MVLDFVLYLMGLANLVAGLPRGSKLTASAWSLRVLGLPGAQGDTGLLVSQVRHVHSQQHSLLLYKEIKEEHRGTKAHSCSRMRCIWRL